MWELLSCYSSSKFNVLPCRATPPLMLLPGMAIMPRTSMISANSMLSTQCPLIIVWVCVFSVLISIETSVQHKIVEEIFKHMFQSQTCISNGKTLIYCPPPSLSLSLSLSLPSAKNAVESKIPSKALKLRFCKSFHPDITAKQTKHFYLNVKTGNRSCP